MKRALVIGGVEYKSSPTTNRQRRWWGKIIPSMNGKYYRLPFKSEQEKTRRYFETTPDDVYSLERAGRYRYGLDVDDWHGAADPGRRSSLRSAYGDLAVLTLGFERPESRRAAILVAGVDSRFRWQ